MTFLSIKLSGRIGNSNATFSQSVALDIAAYGRPSIFSEGSNCFK